LRGTVAALPSSQRSREAIYSNKKSKAELFQMLAEAVRNTQPQPVSTQPEPIHDAQSAPRRRNTQPAPKRAVKIKRVRR
jgi:hypothetical protein